jgi:hypothetical protein
MLDAALCVVRSSSDDVEWSRGMFTGKGLYWLRVGAAAILVVAYLVLKMLRRTAQLMSYRDEAYREDANRYSWLEIAILASLVGLMGLTALCGRAAQSTGPS